MDLGCVNVSAAETSDRTHFCEDKIEKATA